MSDKHLKTALKKLSANNLASGLPGRESHFNEIYNFLYERLKIRETTATKRAKVESGQVADIKGRHMNKTMFVCGVPGTGKTVTTMRVVHELKKLLASKPSTIHKFNSLYINGQHLASPEKVYSEILFQLTQLNYGPEKAQEKLEELFKSDFISEVKPRNQQKNKKVGLASSMYQIIIIDELDLLYNPRRQTVFYSLFDWPTSSESRMILIAIANAMDLPERFMQGRINSRLGWNKLVFESYTSQCLETILRTRLGQDLMDECFDSKAIIIATKRIGRTTGDARRILDTCRLAINKAIEKNLSKVTPSIIDQVGFQNLDAARSNYLSTCSPFELLILKATVQQIDKVGEENVDVSGVFDDLCHLMTKKPILEDYVMGAREYQRLLNNLAAVSIIHLEYDKPYLNKKIYLKDSSENFKDLIKRQTIKC